eukprot:937592_1
MTANLTKQWMDLKGKYPSDKVQHWNLKELMDAATYLSKMNEEVQSLNAILHQYGSQLLESQDVVKRSLNVDPRTYQKWNMQQVEIWLNVLENGRYKAYIPKLL